MSSWSLEVTLTECPASPTSAANHFEQVPSKIPSRYSWIMGTRNVAPDSSFHPPSSTMAKLLSPMLTQSHPEWQPHDNIPKGECTKATLFFFFFAFLQIYQPGEEKSDIGLSHMVAKEPTWFFWNQKKQVFHFPLAESSRAWHSPFLWGTKPNAQSGWKNGYLCYIIEEDMGSESSLHDSKQQKHWINLELGITKDKNILV